MQFLSYKPASPIDCSQNPAPATARKQPRLTARWLLENGKLVCNWHLSES